MNMASRNGLRKSEEENLLAENDRMLDNLAGKVSRLKAIAVDIKHDADNQNKYLDGMDDQFNGAGGLLNGSSQRLQQVIKSARSDRKCMCYMILGLVTTFFVFYYGLSWIKT
ncbi:BET1-like protein [Xenia sp. Carnegie-2017]|uniref:BET1-like protein n=1 Tax=Xenia sp. Carnegie-2017 TaxID=2897299 RepID=UPI001F04CE11|nr:BET1-like protein [Xenia sp. Carnegie-2017]